MAQPPDIASPGPAAPAVSFGKYTLERRLGAGGMAEVFLARTRGPAGFSKSVVVKRILPRLAEIPELVQMFLNEARLAAQLDHPNIVQVFELGEEAGVYFIAMELVDGVSLQSLIRCAAVRGERLPVNVVLSMVALTCAGLTYAHGFVGEDGRRTNLVHRDISPDNILISRAGAVKVSDFGIAKVARAPQLTKTGTVRGKLTYMAPEAIRAQPLDCRSDIFAVGIVLFEALTGRRPFGGNTDLEIMEAIVLQPHERLAEARPEAPARLQEILDRALAKDREDRYPDCRTLQRDLEKVLVEQGAVVDAADIAALVQRYAPVSTRESVPTAVLTPPSRSAPLPADDTEIGPPIDDTKTIEDAKVSRRDDTIDDQPQTRLMRRAAPTRIEPGRRRPGLRRPALGAAAAIAVGVVALALWPKHAKPPRAPEQPLASEPTRPSVDAAPVPETEAPAVDPDPPEPIAPSPPPSDAEVSPPSHKLAKGALDLRVDPWAFVTIDGARLGPTPMAPIALKPGLHRVVLRNDAYPEKAESVRVRAGQTTTLRVTLGR